MCELLLLIKLLSAGVPFIEALFLSGVASFENWQSIEVHDISPASRKFVNFLLLVQILLSIVLLLIIFLDHG